MAKRTAFVFLALIVCGWLGWQTTGPIVGGDVRLYHRVSGSVARGDVPYISFPFEYPPLSAVLLSAPRLLGSDATPDEGCFRLLFMIVAAAAAAAILPVASDIGTALGLPAKRVTGPYLVIMVALFPLVLARYDIFVTLFTALAVRCLFQDRPAAAGGWLGLGVASKLYPVVLLPVLLSYELARRRPGRAGRLLLACGVVTLVPLLPYVALHSDAYVTFLRYHALRGVHMESTAGAILLLCGKLHLTTVRVVFNYGAHHLSSPAAMAVLRAQPWVAAAALLGTVVLVHRRLTRDAGLSEPGQRLAMVQGAVAVLLVFILTNKVLSPQYLIWVAPFVALLDRRTFAWAAATCGATSLMLIKQYLQLSRQHPAAIVEWNLRNAALVGLLVWVVATMRRSAPAAVLTEPVEGPYPMPWATTGRVAEPSRLAA